MPATDLRATFTQSFATCSFEVLMNWYQWKLMIKPDDLSSAYDNFNDRNAVKLG